METAEMRGTSSVVGVILLVGLVVTLAGSVLATGMTMDSLTEPPPSVVAEGEDVLAGCTGCGPDDQIVRLHHETGDVVPVEEMALVVETSDGDKRARLVDLPLSHNCIPDSHVEGVDLFDGRCGRVSGSLTAVAPDTDGTWSAGETLAVRLQKSEVRLDPDESLAVRVVHTPTEQTITENTLAVVDGRPG